MKPKKRFGQNFLHDRNIIGKIANAVDPAPDDQVVEIGPGKGALTRELHGRCRLTVVELDRELAALLRRDTELAGVEIIESDVLKLDLAELGSDLRLVGNLPYNVSTPILFWALKSIDRVRDLHFMLQKEVVDRMAASPGGKDYGRLSVMLQYRCRVQPLFRVPPGAFYPVPKVDSAVVRLVPRERIEPAAGDEAVFADVVRRAFSQRRKTAANALKGLATPEHFEVAGLDPRARAEQFSVADFVNLSNAVAGKTVDGVSE